MMAYQQSAALKALGTIERFKFDLKLLASGLEAAPLWRPGAALLKQCEEALRMIGGIAERFEHKLVVTLVGPCGSGKSTLLNALAGIDDLSEVGHRRPTTANLVVFSNRGDDARQLRAQLSRETVEIRTSPPAVLLEHVLLIDTPDTDSRALEKHLPMVQKAIALSDVLICVFDAENPKRRDHVDFLAPFVRLFHGESLVGVINKCDRLDEAELKNQILPDFAGYIQTAWQVPVNRVLCISARRHLQNPEWDDMAGPRHEFDQFSELHELVFETFNRARYVADRRIENARSLRDFVFNEFHLTIREVQAPLDSAAERITTAERQALLDAVSAMRHNETRQFFAVDVVLYQKLAQRWLGPVGWMIAIWARLLIFGTGLLGMLRLGHPLSQILGMISALRHFKDAKSAIDESQKNQQVDAAFAKYRLAIRQSWPDIAEMLVKAGFDGAVRKVEEPLSAGGIISDRLASLWAATLDNEIERMAGRLSGAILQLLFNIPGISIMGYTGWLTLTTFFRGHYLSADFFLHAFLALSIVLLLSFFILQGWVRWAAGADRITGRAFGELRNQVEHLDSLSMHPAKAQLETVRGLVTDVHP
ncbi:MAG: 50S ribosome-binding GTPase [Desulfobacterales bacterium]|nr:MAG: 50S ribosome-binding GTPase [Desulfobacterales bacterium]